MVLSPYSFEGRLFNAYDQYMSLIKNPDDWAVFTDGDTLFFHSDFGHLIREYIDSYPDTGMFTCYTNRIGTGSQLYDNKLMEIDSIKYNFLIADHLRRERKGKITQINSPVSGFFMVIKRKTWAEIKNELKLVMKNKRLLGVDYAISNILMQKGFVIRRMDAVLMLHYYRFVEGTSFNRGLT